MLTVTLTEDNITMTVFLMFSLPSFKLQYYFSIALITLILKKILVLIFHFCEKKASSIILTRPVVPECICEKHNLA